MNRRWATARRRRSLWIALGASAAISLLVAAMGHLLDDDDGGAREPDRGAPSGERPPPRACTLIGCTSSVVVRLVSLPPGVRSARVCVEGRCGSATPIRGPGVVRGPLPRSERRAGNLVSVTVELRDRHGAVTRRLPGIARVRRTRPNGPGCPPTCFQARLRLDGSGRLRRA